jgi:cell division protein FtsB
VYEFDNRDSAQMYEYLEARIEALKRRIVELEAENDDLRKELMCESYAA